MNAIVETGVFFGTLGSSDKLLRIYCSDNLSFDVARAEQFARVIDKNQAKTITIFSLYLDTALSTVLVTRPYPIDVKIKSSRIVDSGAFIEQLHDRTSTFGSLSLKGVDLEAKYLRLLFDRFDLFESLQVGALPNDLLLKLLSAPLKSIGFKAGAENNELDLTTAEIVPKEIRVKTMYNDFPPKFMVSFFHRVAELGHLESLKLSTTNSRRVSSAVRKALFHAIGVSKKLETLKLYVGANILGYRMARLFDLLEKHEGLQTFHLYNYPTIIDRHFSWLKQLLKRNRRIHVNDEKGNDWVYDDELKEIYAMNRFVSGSERLTKEATLDRPVFMGAAFTHSAAGDFQRAGLLLKDHVDIFCEILHELELTGRADEEDSLARRNTEDGKICPAQPESRAAGQKRQRSETEE